MSHEAKEEVCLAMSACNYFIAKTNLVKIKKIITAKPYALYNCFTTPVDTYVNVPI